MRRRRLFVALVAVIAMVAVAVAALRPGADPDDPHAGVAALETGASPGVLAAVEAASTRQDRSALVAEGRALFRSSALARSGESCQSCHTEGGGANPELGTIVHPQRPGDFRGPRDVPSLWGVARTAPYGWAATTPKLEDFVIGTIASHFAEGATQPDEVTGRQAAALTAYLRSLDPPVTDFDQGTLSPAALRGEDLFQGKAGCMACHAGPLLTDNALHDTFVPKVTPQDTDPGAATTGPLAGAFNTPHLRDVAATAPYMHNGSIPTLREVVEFYDHSSSVAPLDLTPAEVDDLVAYLESL